jgi:hypothetical protein
LEIAIPAPIASPLRKSPTVAVFPPRHEPQRASPSGVQRHDREQTSTETATLTSATPLPATGRANANKRQPAQKFSAREFLILILNHVRI